MKQIFLFMVLLCMILSSSCDRPTAGYFVRDLDSIARKLVPDKREGVFDVRMYIKGKDMVLTGETDSREVKNAVVGFLKSKGVSYTDSLVVMPDTSEVKLPWGIVRISTCNIRASASHGAEMTTQAILGTPVRLLRYYKGWYYIQTPDLYLGWVDDDAIQPLREEMLNSWKSSDRVIFTGLFGQITDRPENGKPVTDVCLGNIAVQTAKEGKYIKVLLPDGRTGYADESTWTNFRQWAVNAKPEFQGLFKTAVSMTGTPYLWGGTSVKGVDCSGFIKTVYFNNGLILSRDVSLMFPRGKVIDNFKNTDSLEPGDLLFFGSIRNGRPRATHVGMYAGNTEFIHSSGLVRINSLDSTRANFDSYRWKTFIGARRVIGSETGRGLLPVSGHNWYF
ncbi:MAG: C40 family peptidase [Bacteroidales bacterium]